MRKNFITWQRLIWPHLLNAAVVFAVTAVAICSMTIKMLNYGFDNKTNNIDYFFNNILDGVSFMIDNAIGKIRKSNRNNQNTASVLCNMIKQRNSLIFHSFVWSAAENTEYIVATREKATTKGPLDESVNDLSKLPPAAENGRIYFGHTIDNFLDNGTKILPVYSAVFDQNKYLGTVFVIIDANKFCMLLRKANMTEIPYVILDSNQRPLCSPPQNKFLHHSIKSSIPIDRLRQKDLIKIFLLNSQYKYRHHINEYRATAYLIINRAYISHVLLKEKNILWLVTITLVGGFIAAVMLQKAILNSLARQTIRFMQLLRETPAEHKLKEKKYTATIGPNEISGSFMALKKHVKKQKMLIKKLQTEYKKVTQQKNHAYLIAEIALLGQEEANAKVHEITISNQINLTKYEYIQNKLGNHQQKADNILSLLADVNHELRTPLSSIIGFTDLMLLNKVLPPKFIEYLGYIKNCSHYLLYLIGDIMDIIRIEEGVIALEESPVDMLELIESCIAYLKNDTEEKKIVINNYSYNAHNALPELYADKNRIRQIILNILANSIKYMGKNGRNIDIYCYSYDNLILIIRDNGAGIPESDLGKIFNKYTRGENQQNVEGFGLGMSLIERLVKMHNGQLIVESKPNLGTKTTIVFPESRVIRHVFDENSSRRPRPSLKDEIY